MQCLCGFCEAALFNGFDESEIFQQRILHAASIPFFDASNQ